jgi:hypothetical protein
MAERLRGLLPQRPRDDAGTRDEVAERRRRIAIECLLVLCGSALLAVVLTWPLLLDLGSEVPGGGNGGDRSGYVYDVWFNERFGLNLWGMDLETAVSAPFGRDAPGSLNMLQITFLGPAWLVSLVAGPIVGVNVSVLLGMTLAAAAMYLLIRWIGAGVAPAIWAAVAFSIFPNALVRITGHYPLALLACFPLILLAAWRWLERPGLRRACWLAAACGFCWLTNPYWGVMGLVAVTVAGVAGIVMTVRGDGWTTALRRAGELTAAVMGIVFLPLAAMFWSTRDSVENGLTRTRVDLDVYGARLTDYLLPDVGQRFFVDVFGAEWADIAAPGGERSNFLGYGTMGLAVLGLVLGYRYRRTLTARTRIVLVTALPMALVMVWFSLATPTRWFGVTIPTPSDALFNVLPFLRVYARFAVPVTALVICLGAIGLHLALRDRRPVIVGLFVVPLIALAVVELPPGGGVPVTSGPPIVLSGRPAEQFAAWRYLRDEVPDDAIVHAFPSYTNELVERFHMYGQTVHGLDITNGDAQAIGVGSDVTSSIPDPRWPGAARALSTLGVDYVTVIPELYAFFGVTPPDVERPPAGFAVVEVFPDGAAVWRVTATPRDGLAIVRRDNWWTPARREGRSWRFMRDDAIVHLYAPVAGRYRLAFGARSAAGPREMVAEVDDRTVLTRTIGAQEEVTVVVDLPEGLTDIRLANPGYAADAIPSGDPRAWSFEVSDIDMTRIGG